MGLITTSIVVDFTGAANSAGLSAEVDSRLDGFNKGRTVFNAGETVGILVRATAAVRAFPITVLSSYAPPTFIRTVTETITQEVHFLNSNTATLGKEITSISSVTWFGNNLGPLAFSGTDITSSIKGVAVAEVTYTTTALLYSIPSPSLLGGRSYFNILVYVKGSEGLLL